MKSTELDESSLMNTMSSVVDQNHNRREALLNKLLPAVDGIDLSSVKDMRASDRESIMGVFATVDSIMKSQEAAQEKRVKIFISNKDVDQQANHSEAVLETLRMINPRKGALRRTNESNDVDLTDADEKIAEITDSKCDPISDDELAVEE